MSALVRPAPLPALVAPLVGATFSYVHDPLQMMRRQYDACGPVSETTFVGEKVTILLRTGRVRSRSAQRRQGVVQRSRWARSSAPSSSGG